MSLLIEDGKDAVHKPKRRDVFEFDEEVSVIFENMATRSIPMYAEMHRTHTKILSNYVHDVPKYHFKVADLGSSTGVFFKFLSLALQNDHTSPPGHGVECWAFDNSEGMVNKLRENCPWVTARDTDLTKWEPYSGTYDCVNATYLIQFLPDTEKMKLISKIYHSMVSGGILFLGQKDQLTQHRGMYLPDEWVERNLEGQYIQFRQDNGYTLDEIGAKTEALKNSMWPIRHDVLLDYLKSVGFSKVIETTRWLNFSSLMAIK